VFLKSPTIDLVTRREAIRRVSALLGGAALIGQSVWLAGCEAGNAARPRDAASFSATDIALLDEIADTILPETKTPGAKAAGVGAFMALMVTDTYDVREQRLFSAGLRSIERLCMAQHGVSFLAASPAQRRTLLEQLDREQYTGRPPDGDEERRPHYFRMIKELTLLGYFTSEVGCTQAMRYVETPGRFEPCVTYTAGEKAWAPHG
jgi:hypothetical protein